MPTAPTQTPKTATPTPPSPKVVYTPVVVNNTVVSVSQVGTGAEAPNEGWIAGPVVVIILLIGGALAYYAYRRKSMAIKEQQEGCQT